MDAMVDSHYAFSGKRVALALEADHLKGLPVPPRDGLRDRRGALRHARAGSPPCRPRRCPSATSRTSRSRPRGGPGRREPNGRQAVAKLGVKAHLRTGVPVFDRLGAHQKVWVGYRGTMNLVFEVANLFQASATEAQRLAHN